MNAPQSKPDPQRTHRTMVVRRRVSRQRTESDSLDKEFPVLFRLPDLLSQVTVWHATGGDSKQVSSYETTNDIPSILAPTALPVTTHIVAAAHEAATGSVAGNARSTQDTQAVAVSVEPVGQAMPSATPLAPALLIAATPSAAVARPTAEAVTLQSVVRQVTELNTSLSSGQKVGPRHETAAGNLEREPVRPASPNMQRERRRRHEDDLPLDTQSMTRQWATVLVLVAVISTSFYLLNRPRENRESPSGPSSDSMNLDGVARKSKGMRAKPPARKPDVDLEADYGVDENTDAGAGAAAESSTEENVDDDLSSGQGALMEPAVPPPLSRGRGGQSPEEAAPAENSDLQSAPSDELSTVAGRSYPTTDPRRYEFSSEGARIADRGGPERSR